MKFALPLLALFCFTLAGVGCKSTSCGTSCDSEAKCCGKCDSADKADKKCCGKCDKAKAE